MAFSITSLSSVYEILEWRAAELVRPADAVAYLGIQGNVFDSQKDMGLAVVGALIAWTLGFIFERVRRRATMAKQFILSLYSQAG